MNAHLKKIVMIAVITSGFISACAEKPINQGDARLAGLLRDAEKNARAGNFDQALKSVDAAESALISEDKGKPYPQPNKQWTGEDPKAAADQEALRRLIKARQRLKAELAGEAGDEIAQAAKAVQEKAGD